MKQKKSNNMNEDKNLPGYPHYPAKEDLLNAEPENRIDGDVEDVLTSEKKSAPVEDLTGEEQVGETIEMVPGNEADVTEEDMYALGPKDHDMDEGEDETLLPLIMEGPDLTGDDLDVPGSDEDRPAAEESGSEDEENKYYSFGQ
jgi:hypothetical protein